MRNIYDCFLFFNELDLLEIRLELLYDNVDFFVISETKKTHSGKDKPLYYNENKHNFSKYHDKIIHVINDFPNDIYTIKKPNGTSKNDIQFDKIVDLFNIESGEWKSYPNWCREQLQREFIKLGLINCNDDDIIMISDLDEIPNPEFIKTLKNIDNTKRVMLQDCHYYYINNLCSTNWYGNAIVDYKYTLDKSLSSIRTERTSYEKIYNGGWHLSFMGGEDRIKQKIEGYAHQEFNNNNVKNNISNVINRNSDIYNRRSNTYQSTVEQYYFDNMQNVNINNGYYPSHIIDLINQKYKYLIK